MLIPDKIYKIYCIYNSFKKSLDLLFDNIIMSEYSIIDIKYRDSYLSPDDIKIGSFLNNFKKPEYLYISIFLVSNSVEICSGFGHKYCECKLNSNQKIYVNWDSSISHSLFLNKKYSTFDNKCIRKIKLKNIEKT